MLWFTAAAPPDLPRRCAALQRACRARHPAPVASFHGPLHSRAAREGLNPHVQPAARGRRRQRAGWGGSGPGEVEGEGLDDERGGVAGIEDDGAVGLGDIRAGEPAGGLGGRGPWRALGRGAVLWKSCRARRDLLRRRLRRNSRSLGSTSRLFAALSKKVIDLDELRILVAQDVADAAGVRATVWKLLYLPSDHALWEQELAKKREQYTAFKDEILRNPEIEILNLLEIARRVEAEGHHKVNVEHVDNGFLHSSDVTREEHPLSLGRQGLIPSSMHSDG